MNCQSEKNCDPAQPLKNKRRELFCRLYATEYWGRPGEAMLRANYQTPVETAEKNSKALLESPDIRARISYLREIRSAGSIADAAWIKEALIDIVRTAKKDSDRIRALANLTKVVLIPERHARLHEKSAGESGLEQDLFPFFEGNQDGGGNGEKAEPVSDSGPEQ